MKSKNYRLSRKAEDYMRAILNITLEKGYVRTGDISDELGVSSPSVVEMFKKLDMMGLIEYRKYDGVSLKPEGRKIAEEIKYRHDTILEFLRLIGIPDKIARMDACVIEHELHPETVEQIRLFVEYLSEYGTSDFTSRGFGKFCIAKKLSQINCAAV